MKKTCFAMFPFGEQKPYKNRVEKIYKPALEAAGLTVEIAGGAGAYILPDDIRNKIKESTFCFADVTEVNENVCYEMGMAHADGKKVIMVCNTDKRNLSDLPFDVSHIQCFGYSEKIDTDEDACDEFKGKITADVIAKMKEEENSLIKQILGVAAVGLFLWYVLKDPPRIA